MPDLIEKLSILDTDSQLATYLLEMIKGALADNLDNKSIIDAVGWQIAQARRTAVANALTRDITDQLGYGESVAVNVHTTLTFPTPPTPDYITQIKTGDSVICVDPTPVLLQLNCVYIVEKISPGGYVKLTTVEGFWAANRFELAQ